MHVDWQQIAALAIVVLAAFTLGRRLWGQIAAFRAKPGRSSGGCESCPGSGAAKTGPAASPALMQIQIRPPAHLRRPPSQ